MINVVKRADRGSPSVGGHGRQQTEGAPHPAPLLWVAGSDDRATSIPQGVCHNGDEGIPG